MRLAARSCWLAEQEPPAAVLFYLPWYLFSSIRVRVFSLVPHLLKCCVLVLAESVLPLALHYPTKVKYQTRSR